MVYGAFTHCGLFIDGIDLTGISNMVKVTAIKEVKERNTFGNTGKVRVMAGVEDVTLTAAGFMDMTAAGQGVQLLENYGDSDICVGFIMPAAGKTATAIGDYAYFFKGAQPQYEAGGAHGEDLPWTLNLTNSGSGYPLVFGKALSTGNVALTEDGNGTGVEVGAVAAGQYVYAMLHVTEVSADDSIVVTIESDDNADFTSATTRFTFASKAAVGAEYLARVAGPITDTHWRAVYDVTGEADISIKCAVLLGIQ